MATDGGGAWKGFCGVLQAAEARTTGGSTVGLGGWALRARGAWCREAGGRRPSRARAGSARVPTAGGAGPWRTGAGSSVLGRELA